MNTAIESAFLAAGTGRDRTTQGQRFAQEALGHSSRAVHEAYAKGAAVICPALDEYETINAGKLVPMPLRATWSEPARQTAS